jgi:hypothetical protein
VPDRFGHSAGEVDLGDLGAALFADASFRRLVAVAIHRSGAGVGGGLDQRPAEIARSLLGERATQVALAGLVDAGAEAGDTIAAELGDIDRFPSPRKLAGYRLIDELDRETGDCERELRRLGADHRY